jgi:hypothetical protein
MDVFYTLQPTVTKNYWFVKETVIRIAFRNIDTKYDILKLKTTNTTDEYTKSGIYKLTFSTCNRSNVEQTSCNLKKKRYMQHTRHIRNNDLQSAYAAHILNSVPEYRNINNRVSLLKRVNKSPYLNSVEHFYSQMYSYDNKLVPKQCTISTYLRSPVTSLSHVNCPQMHLTSKNRVPVLSHPSEHIRRHLQYLGMYCISYCNYRICKTKRS